MPLKEDLKAARAYGATQSSTRDALLGLKFGSKSGATSVAEDKAQAIANPAAEVTTDFMSGGADQTVGDFTDIDIGGPDFTPSDLTMHAVESQQIPGMFAPLIQDIESQKAPLGRPAPASFSPAQTFAATFAGIMGSQLSKNPAILENIQQKLSERAQRVQAIQDQNYANDLLFNKEKQAKLVALRGQILEKQIDTAIQEGRDEDARIAAENLATLRAKYDRDLKILEERGALARTKLEVSGRIAASGKEVGLSMKDYASSLEQIETADPKKLAEESKKFFGGKKVVSKQDAVLMRHAMAALGGADEAVRGLGLQRLLQGEKEKYKFGGKLTPQSVQGFAAELRSMGIPWDIISGELSKYGVKVTK